MIKKTISLLCLLAVFSVNGTGSVILLHGTSSAGKSSTQRALKKLLGENFMVLSIDDYGWKAMINLAKELNLINDSMSFEEQQRICVETDNIVFNQKQSDLAYWVEVMKYYYDDVHRLAIEGHNIIMDTAFGLLEDGDIDYFRKTMSDVPTFTVLIYCSPEALAQHTYDRNCIVVDLAQMRSISEVLKTFCTMYKVSECDELPVAQLCLDDIKKALKIAEKNLIEMNADQSLKQRTDILENVLQVYIKAFGLDLHDSVSISPKFLGNFTVNSGINSAIECADQIKKAYEAHTALL
ncbi:MAG: hypothetical protein NTZ68_04235 [Candidatus Dependentiae bacterium]|nr:hypothetical protein [Candidatus Dependentiae bacterium]